MIMETKMIKIPFEVELAKKISNGEVEGRIVTRDGRSVRIICWDRKDKDFPIVSLAGNSESECIFHKINGEYCLYGKADKDLMLEVPEYVMFKDGDVIVSGWSNPHSNSKWVSIIKDVTVSSHGILIHNYATLILESNIGADDLLKYDDYSNTGTYIERATESEKQKLIDALKVSDDPRAKECLKKLGIEEKPKCEFKPFDRVLVRDLDFNIWYNDIFSFRDKDGKYMCIGNKWDECIPYNEETAHLLGTTDNFEDNK